LLVDDLQIQLECAKAGAIPTQPPRRAELSFVDKTILEDQHQIDIAGRDRSSISVAAFGIVSPDSPREAQLKDTDQPLERIVGGLAA
jgi:hypothetical protein